MGTSNATMLGSLQTHFWAVRDHLAPVLRDSKFKKSGRLTPDEFVAAGDFLAYKFPTWQWESGEASKHRDFLPADKQYLISRNVPCLRRVSQLNYGAGKDDEGDLMMSFGAEGDGKDGDDEWVATHSSAEGGESSRIAQEIGDIPDMEADDATVDKVTAQMASTGLAVDSAEQSDDEKMPDLDDIPDIDDDDLSAPANVSGTVVEEEDDAVAQPQPASTPNNLIQVRTYDCFITYDKYYQTPRFWLLGYDEHKTPLPPVSAFEDVSADHRQKTVTIEPFPHLSLSITSVHPCKHASVMKKVIERMDKSVADLQRRERAADQQGLKAKWTTLKGKKTSPASTPPVQEEEAPEGLRVDQYLVVFLKFMSTIVPTVEVDATASV